MTKELEVANLLRANAALMAVLIGGVYTDEEIGIEGFHRGEPDINDVKYSSTALAFDADGYLLPCALVRQLGEVVVPRTQDIHGGFQAIAQTVQIYFYQDRKHNVIEIAKDMVWDILNGIRVGRSYPIWCDNESPYTYDVGPVQNVTTLRQDWKLVFTKQTVVA